MSITYQLYTPWGSTTLHVKKTNLDGTITTFKPNSENWVAQEYRDWVDAGNTPEPADS